MTATSFDFVLMTVCGWVNRRQLAAIAYLREENRVLRAQLGDKRPKLTDAQRRRLAEKGKALGRKALAELCSIATPDTILGWYRRLIARKYDGSAKNPRGRPRKAQDVRELILRMAKDNSGWLWLRESRVQAERVRPGPRHAQHAVRRWNHRGGPHRALLAQRERQLRLGSVAVPNSMCVKSLMPERELLHHGGWRVPQPARLRTRQVLPGRLLRLVRASGIHLASLTKGGAPDPSR